MFQFFGYLVFAKQSYLVMDLIGILISAHQSSDISIEQFL